MRSAIFTLVGAILLSTATLLYGMVFLDGAVQEPAFFLVIGSTLVGGFLGLLVAELTRPSGIRRTQLILLGAVGGLLAGLAYGVIALEEGCEPGFIDPGPCGWVFLGRLFLRPWTPIALWTVFGGFVGALLGFVASFGYLRRESAVQAGVDFAQRG
jgi:RsiW-degrading membrane proteinase PrsW (M82 family)